MLVMRVTKKVSKMFWYEVICKERSRQTDKYRPLVDIKYFIYIFSNYNIMLRILYKL